MSGPALTITGLAARSAPLGWAELTALPEVVAEAAMVAPGAVGAAVAMRQILIIAAPTAPATHCTVASRDGTYTASIPIDALSSGGWLAFARNGEPLPAELGGPFRLTVADGDTLCWNVKDVGELRFTDYQEDDSVPENPPH